MNEKKRDWTFYLSWFSLLKYALFVGVFGAEFFMRYINELSFLDYIFSFIIFILSFPLHVVLHELGHLIGGYLSGYQFIMFRLFQTVWIQTEAGISKRKQVVQGMLGQALMVPPEGVEKPPFLLYHASGLLMNAVTAGLFIFLGYFIPTPSISMLFYVSAIAAMLLFILNIVPSKGNDGYNILQHFKRPETLKEVTKLLYLYSGMVKGESFTALQRYIDFETLDSIDNPNTITFMTAQASAYYEQYEFDKAREIYEELWNNRNKLIELHKPEVYLNYLYTLLLTNPQSKDIARIKETDVYKRYQTIKTGDGLKVFAAEALYLENDFQTARELLTKGKPMIALAPTVAEEKLEYQMYAYLTKQIDAFEQATH